MAPGEAAPEPGGQVAEHGVRSEVGLSGREYEPVDEAKQLRAALLEIARWSLQELV
jgi:hypothetical protein